MKTLLLLFLFFILLDAQEKLSDDQKIFILTDYLIKQESKTPKQARNEAVATIFGLPYFKELSYDDHTEMFFGRVASTKGSASKLVNFYMPRKRALAYKKNRGDGSIEVKHSLKDNTLNFTDIELSYAGVNYPMAIKSDTSMTLKLGAYFVAAQDTTLYAERGGVGGSLDLQDIFNLTETTQAFRLEFAYEFNQKHRVETSFYSIQNSNTKSVDTFEFDGNTLSGDVNLQFNTDIYKFTYIYSAYRTNAFELNARIGIHLTQFSTGLFVNTTTNGVTTKNEVVNLNIPAPLPVFGLGFNYNLTPELSLKYHVDYFFVSMGVKGTMIDTQVEFNYMINDYIGLGLGLNSTKTDFNTKIDETTFGLNHNISGAIGSLVFKY